MELNEFPIPEQATPGSPRPALEIGVPGSPSGRTTGQRQRHRRRWTRAQNIMVLECYFASQPERRGYRKRMIRLWQQRNPEDNITEQALLDQKRSITKNKHLTEVEIQMIETEMQARDNGVQREETESLNNPVQHTEEMEPEETESGITNEEEDIQVALTEVQVNQRLRIMELMNKYKDIRERPHIRRVFNNTETRSIVSSINATIRSIPTHNLSETNALIYAAAKNAEEHLFTESHNEQRSMPPWKTRLTRKIDQLRKDVNRLTSARDNNGRLNVRIRRKYRLTERRIDEAIEDAKQRLIALSHRLKRYEARNEQFMINRQFSTNPRKVYKKLRKENDADEELPDKDRTIEYWGSLWGSAENYNTSATWMQSIQRKHENLSEQSDIVITTEDVRMKIARMSNWKAPGPDQIQIFWLKKLTSIHERMATQMNHVLTHPQEVPNWLVEGKTRLIRKDFAKEPTPDNYRPITCLPTMWKVFSGIMANKIISHLTTNDILCHEQKGARPQCRATKDQLAIDRTVTRDNKKRHTNLSMAWIDYRKAYDSVPHSWILDCMKLYKINQSVYKLIEVSMQTWRTTIVCGKEEIGQIQVKRGIFQGDSLSPILFCLALNPLSEILHEAGREYTLGSGEKINHLLYMDDLKLYSKKENDLTLLINNVKTFSNDINMKFGFDKCARLIIHRGKVKTTDGLELEGSTIRDVESEGYKYLGIPQQQTNLDEVAKTNAKKEYKKRIKQVLKSKLYAKNKILAINQYAVPVIAYTGGIIKWRQDELQALNRTTRKTMNMYGALHPRADVDRLYVPRNLGGRGLKDLAETVHSEDRSLAEYIQDNEDDPVLAVARSGDLYPQKAMRLEEWQKKTTEERCKRWQEKPLHGQYARQIESVTTKQTRYTWLKDVNLKIETEALITAAQEQALCTKVHKARIMRISTDSKCRMCKAAEETVTHLLTACEKLAGSQYLNRHNEVAKIIHRNICREYGIPTPERVWHHNPLSVTDTERVKLLWDFEIRTDHRIQARRPDIVIIDKNKRKATIIDIAVPDDRNIMDKEREKIAKYQDLRLEIMRLWNVRAQVIPIVVGALGAHSTRLREYLDLIPGDHRKPELVKAAILGSAHILRWTLDLPESW